MRWNLEANGERRGRRARPAALWRRAWPLAPAVVAGLAVPALLLLTLAGCSHAPPAEKLAKDVEPVGSWLATLQMAAEAWSGNRVPAHYLHDTIDAAKSAIEKAADAAKGSDASPAVRQPLRRVLAEGHVACRQLDQAVTRGDRGAAAALAARFGALHDRFEAWKQQAGGGGS